VLVYVRAAGWGAHVPDGTKSPHYTRDADSMLLGAQEPFGLRRERHASAAERRAAFMLTHGLGVKGTVRKRSGTLALAVIADRNKRESENVTRVVAFQRLRFQYGDINVSELVQSVPGGEAQVDLEQLETCLKDLGLHDIDHRVEMQLSQCAQGAAISTRWGRLLQFLPLPLQHGLLGALLGVYGAQCETILATEWSCDWAQWDGRRPGKMDVAATDEPGLVQALQKYDFGSDADIFSGGVLDAIHKRVRRHVCLAAEHSVVVHKTDADMKDSLTGQGFVFGIANGKENNCLSDSLLQLLESHGFVDSLSRQQREKACVALREDLNLLPPQDPLRPRSREGVEAMPDAGAFLQHDLHAGYALDFFRKRFALGGRWKLEFPNSGVRVTVRSRHDSQVLPPSTLVVCTSLIGRAGTFCVV
jgi:hypothetical protein